MDRAQAVEIQRHVLDAAAAIDRASKIIFAFDRDDREVFATPLAEVVSALHFELLQKIYVRYPDLRPSIDDEDRGMIDTTQRWEEIVLPDSVSEADLDSIIFSFLRPRWQKTAKILGDAFKRCETLALPVDLQVLAARLEALADANRLEVAGDLRKWRYSEVRLNAEEDRDA